MGEFNHYSVLLEETVDALNINPEGTYVDCTLGGGGHSLEIVKKLTTGRLISIDRDTDAIEASKERLKEHLDKITFVHDNYKNIKLILSSLGIDSVEGVTADLGVSSYQLDTPERGFSFHHNAHLDMRMNRCDSLDAEKVVNEYSEAELRRVISEYGEEKWAARIASGIVRAREKKRILTTFELVDIIKESVPSSYLREKHPARRTFQAIRIEVNDEIGALRSAVSDMIDCLSDKGRIAVITFHSLEDRAVKEVFAERTKGCTCPANFPVCVCGFKPTLKLLGKSKTADKGELSENNRSRSARLRCAEKI
jgi:16S rRNA (cytosine1402-N4)-methyltransferase